MSHVKNLRAIFENKGDSSPLDRGGSSRVSPTRKQSGGISSTSSLAPLSKICMNFVSVEKNGRIGLKRDVSRGSRISTRSPSPYATKNNSRDLKGNSTSPEETVKTFTKRVADQDIAVLASITPGQRTETTRLNRERDTGFHGKYDREMRTFSHTEKIKSDDSSNFHTNADINKSFSTAATIGNNTTAANSTSPAASRSTMNEPKDMAKKKPPDIKTSCDKPKVAATTDMGSSPRLAITASPAAVRRCDPVVVRHQSSDKCLKLKPKSPTKPVHLPSYLIASTVSSASKVYGSESSHQRQPGTMSAISTSFQPYATPDPSSLSSDGFIRKRDSPALISRPRLGPSSSKCLSSKATKKKPGNIDEGFLARVTRPTHSSASKLVDKVRLTPTERKFPAFGGRQHWDPSDRASARSVNSRCLPTRKTSAIKLTERSPPMIIKGAHVIEVKEVSENTIEDKNHELTCSMSGVPKAAAKRLVSEGATGTVSANESDFGTSTTTNVTASSDMVNLRGLINQCSQSYMLDLESDSLSKIGESLSSLTEERTMSEAPTPLTVPNRIAGGEGEVLASLS